MKKTIKKRNNKRYYKKTKDKKTKGKWTKRKLSKKKKTKIKRKYKRTIQKGGVVIETMLISFGLRVLLSALSGFFELMTKKAYPNDVILNNNAWIDANYTKIISLRRHKINLLEEAKNDIIRYIINVGKILKRNEILRELNSDNEILVDELNDKIATGKNEIEEAKIKLNEYCELLIKERKTVKQTMKNCVEHQITIANTTKLLIDKINKQKEIRDIVKNEADTFAISYRERGAINDSWYGKELSIEIEIKNKMKEIDELLDKNTLEDKEKAVEMLNSDEFKKKYHILELKKELSSIENIYSEFKTKYDCIETKNWRGTKIDTCYISSNNFEIALKEILDKNKKIDYLDEYLTEYQLTDENNIQNLAEYLISKNKDENKDENNDENKDKKIKYDEFKKWLETYNIKTDYIINGIKRKIRDLEIEIFFIKFTEFNSEIRNALSESNPEYAKEKIKELKEYLENKNELKEKYLDNDFDEKERFKKEKDKYDNYVKTMEQYFNISQSENEKDELIKKLQKENSELKEKNSRLLQILSKK